MLLVASIQAKHSGREQRERRSYIATHRGGATGEGNQSEWLESEARATL